MKVKLLGIKIEISKIQKEKRVIPKFSGNLPPTRKELDIYDYIIRFKEYAGYFPTRAEIAEYFEITPMGVQNFISNLSKKGLIKTNKKPRSFMIMK